MQGPAHAQEEDIDVITLEGLFQLPGEIQQAEPLQVLTQVRGVLIDPIQMG